MSGTIAIRRETKSVWERRSPLTPHMVRRIVKEKGLSVIVQPSARRVYHDKEYVRAGATVSNDLSPASVVFGVKEIPPDMLEPDTTYVFFSHVIKGQPPNMPMLKRMMELGCTLIDYEMIRDANGRRLIFFGRFAGLAGMIESLRALGQRLRWEGLRSPLAAIEPAHTYDNLDEAKAAVRSAGQKIARDGLPEGLAPLIIGIAGYGNVASGVREILAELPCEEIAPAEVTEVSSDSRHSRHSLYQVTFREEHIVKPRDGGQDFELQDYYQHPERYEACFAPYLPRLTVLMNCNYWDARYPRLVTRSDLRELYSDPVPPRLRLIGDLSCDVDGAIECTVRCTEPGEPVYVFDPATGETASGVAGPGPAVLAVDILPSELPREASETFSECLAPFVAPIARADYGVGFEDLDLPSGILTAVIVHRGALTPQYAHLGEHLAAAASRSPDRA